MKRWVLALIVAVLGVLAGAAVAGTPSDVDDLRIGTPDPGVAPVTIAR